MSEEFEIGQAIDWDKSFRPDRTNDDSPFGPFGLGKGPFKVIAIDIVPQGTDGVGHSQWIQLSKTFPKSKGKKVEKIWNESLRRWVNFKNNASSIRFSGAYFKPLQEPLKK